MIDMNEIKCKFSSNCVQETLEYGDILTFYVVEDVLHQKLIAVKIPSDYTDSQTLMLIDHEGQVMWAQQESAKGYTILNESAELNIKVFRVNCFGEG